MAQSITMPLSMPTFGPAANMITADFNAGAGQVNPETRPANHGTRFAYLETRPAYLETGGAYLETPASGGRVHGARGRVLWTRGFPPQVIQRFPRACKVEF
jgi:hypothetical protein